MRTKVQWASAIALAATVLATLFGAQGSGAAASDMLPVPAQQESAVTFVSEPVVQAVASDNGERATDDTTAQEGVEENSDVASLAELVAEQDMPGTLSREMRCLAGAIYFEARGETLEGQLAVGRVIINRAASEKFPDSYCGVVLQRSQFSFVRGHAMPSVREHSASWQQAVAIAQIARDGSWKSPAKGALFFHATRVSPNWRLTRVGRIDNHIFYR
ncbi:cell wall hydrolase [Novosphingobium album (ex Hu et al. 2023)]|uniref:Cell wall hydrolase n=1 Tax=Novosphingobium album (ex Hu et al. 2023) TaxID=2930093 RepID=A0ABT0B4B4_9SPHN|nr:cell wall hydrolase [Novosphingobium album (ex Hu et al. 2023)]MCJ2179902.1 cell wall hydrolase [Novosphingobium album (ex Hu et al. 2023)]